MVACRREAKVDCQTTRMSFVVVVLLQRGRYLDFVVVVVVVVDIR